MSQATRIPLSIMPSNRSTAAGPLAADQQTLIDRLRIRVEWAVSTVVQEIAAGGFVKFSAQLESLAVKEGIACKLKLIDASHDLEELMERVGGSTVLVLIDMPSYIEGMQNVRAEPGSTLACHARSATTPASPRRRRCAPGPGAWRWPTSGLMRIPSVISLALPVVAPGAR